MEPKEIIVYLKGAINLGKIKSLNEYETRALKDMLKITQSTEENKEKQLCAWLEGYLECLDSSDVPADKFNKIAGRLLQSESTSYEANTNVNTHAVGGNLGQRLPGGAIAKC